MGGEKSDKETSAQARVSLFDFSSPEVHKSHILSRMIHLIVYLRPKVTLHCHYIYLFWVMVSGILNVFN